MLKLLEKLFSSFIKKQHIDTVSVEEDSIAQTIKALTLYDVALKFRCPLKRVKIDLVDKDEDIIFTININEDDNYRKTLVNTLKILLKETGVIYAELVPFTVDNYYPNITISLNDLRDDLKVMCMMYKGNIDYIQPMLSQELNKNEDVQ